MAMNTPICDFVQKYSRANPLRLHMPGHKGCSFLGVEHLDITEIEGADSLYEAEGIIAQSEDNAGRIFGCKTFYSTEGSSQCIRAMLYLVQMHSKPKIAAGRNAHKSFLTAAALLDMDVDWLYPRDNAGYLSCALTAEDISAYLEKTGEKPAAIYLTNPDYLGNMVDVAAIAELCHKNGVLLLVDNAHGAYLKFLPQSRHPMDLGADICCDSAHKTLPVLTGGAYLHLSKECDEKFGSQVKNAMAIFGSTSPSYLILQSLDRANVYLDTYEEKLRPFLKQVNTLKEKLQEWGYGLYGNEPLKITLAAKAYGYTGAELGEILIEQGIIPEFYDCDYLVLMLTPETGREGLERLEEVLMHIPPRAAISERSPLIRPAEQAMSIREAMLSCSELVSVSESLGRILAVPTVGCPPAVPIVACGERIDSHAISCFDYYGIKECCVVE
ncbi:MAG: aminotransferase class V-fold PLP-dependent enzyme [Oscillospiraceae bacterium]|nr:aminotransferase class V-fold PLP-dependent enzyme [Oscillospiraceae bacterium]